MRSDPDAGCNRINEYISSFRGLEQIAKRLFRPWLEFKWIRMFTDYDKIVDDFRTYSDAVVKGVCIPPDPLKALVNYYFAFEQIIQRSIAEGCSTDSFVDKLITIAQENPDFSFDDVKIEAHTLLIGVNDNN